MSCWSIPVTGGIYILSNILVCSILIGVLFLLLLVVGVFRVDSVDDDSSDGCIITLLYDVVLL
jgi:hypothetical protein